MFYIALIVNLQAGAVCRVNKARYRADMRDAASKGSVRPASVAMPLSLHHLERQTTSTETTPYLAAAVFRRIYFYYSHAAQVLQTNKDSNGKMENDVSPQFQFFMLLFFWYFRMIVLC